MKILENSGQGFDIIDYMKSPLSINELKSLSNKMGLRPKEFIRNKESIFKELELQNHLDNDEILFRYMSENPKLIERPIVVRGDNAVMCRPVNNINSIL